jgi:hypothetical protein
MKILVGDDDSISRMSMKRAKRKFGYKTELGIALTNIDSNARMCFDMRR